jgi:small GTP-binding protein
VIPVDARKICILGDFAVGKTSLVSRYIHGQFSDRYHTSIGVKVDTKEVTTPAGRSITLAIWDVAGTDTPTELFLRYLRGSSGYLLVADGTREETLTRALQVREAVESQLAVLPFVGLINKADLREEQEIEGPRIALMRSAGEIWLHTSARNGDNVERSFALLLEAMGA